MKFKGKKRVTFKGRFFLARFSTYNNSSNSRSMPYWRTKTYRTNRVTARVRWTTLSIQSLKRIKSTDFVRRTQNTNLPLLYGTSYAPQASISYCNFSHILNRYDPRQSPPCFGGLFVEERLSSSSKYKPASFPGSSLLLHLAKNFPRVPQAFFIERYGKSLWLWSQ